MRGQRAHGRLRRARVDGSRSRFFAARVCVRFAAFTRHAAMALPRGHGGLAVTGTLRSGCDEVAGARLGSRAACRPLTVPRTGLASGLEHFSSRKL
jgi:hypothetical protein